MKKLWIIPVIIAVAATAGVTALAKGNQREAETVTCLVSEAETQVKGESNSDVKKPEAETKVKAPQKDDEESTAEIITNIDTVPAVSEVNQAMLIEEIKAKYRIDSTYLETADRNFNGCTAYSFIKLDKNGIPNVYDSLNVTIDNETGEIIAEKRFDNPAFIEAKIDKKAAKEAAIKNHPRFDENNNLSVNKCVLEYYMPKYPKGDIYLAYRTEFDDGNVVYINAVSGEAVGFDQMK